MGQNVSAEGVDVEDADDHSDLEVMETQKGWTVVRTAAVEEQAAACHLVMLLAEKMQEHFYPYVSRIVEVLDEIDETPHEDVRSFVMVAWPELIRATAKATAPDKDKLLHLLEIAIDSLCRVIRYENVVVLIMTGLQALRAVMNYASRDWIKDQSAASSTSAQPAPLTPATSVPTLSTRQLTLISETARIVLQESLQRRAVLRAEAQVLMSTPNTPSIS